MLVRLSGKAMKIEHKVIYLSIIFGLLVWITDAVLDYFLFYEGTLLGLLFYDIPSHEIYMRTLIIILFLAFGVLVSRILVKLKQTENYLKEARDGLANKVKERTDELNITNEQLKQKIAEGKQGEAALKNTNDYLDNVVESSLDCIVITDSTGHIARANKSLVKLLGYSEEEVKGEHLSAFIPTKEGVYESTTGKSVEINEDFFNDAQTMMSRLFEEGKISDWEIYLIDRNERLIPVEQNIVYLRNEQGDIIGAVDIIRDITERKKAEEEKTGIEARLQDKVTELSIINEVAELLLSTRELEEILHMILIGATAYQALGFNRAFLLLINEEENMLEGKVATGSLSGEEAYKIWDRMAHESQPLHELIKSHQGELSKEDGPVNDLVKHIKIPLNGADNIFTRAIYGNKSFNILDGTNNPLIDKKIIERLGTDTFALVPLVSRGQALGVLLADNFINKKPICNEDVERLRAFSNHASLAIENSRLYKNLERKVKELSGAYNELRENNDKLIRYERLSALGKVAAEITHEIRSPLVSIGGFARRILKKTKDKEINIKYVKIIIEEINRLENILADILSFAKPLVPNNASVDLNRVVKNTFEVLGSEIEKSNIHFEEYLDPNLPMLYLDENQIKRVLINIIKNAIEATPAEGIISVSTIIENEWAKVDIADNGVGISDDEVDKLFDAFFTRKSTGSGLGLTISAQIINNHGGTIDVKKREPRGTIFSIKLPINNSL
jgi:hypothetical protein